MKDYNKFMREEVYPNDAFEIIKNGNKPTIKLKHKTSGQIYSIHPGDNAVFPLRKWIKKFEE